MAQPPTTSTTLLRDLAQDSQHARWGEFVARYRPMMEAFLRERFPSVEADDVIQETLIAVCTALPSYRYSPDEKGHFRNYLTGKPSQKEGGNGQPQKPAPGSAEARLQERRSKRMASAMQLMDDYSTGRQNQEE